MATHSSILAWKIPWTEDTGRLQLVGLQSQKVKPLSHVQLFATPWTVAYQVPPSMGFSRQEYWSGLPFPSPGVFPTQGWNPGLLHCRQMLCPLSHQGSRVGNDRATKHTCIHINIEL